MQFNTEAVGQSISASKSSSDAAKKVESNGGKKFVTGPPVAYLDEGTIHFRIYPANDKGKLYRTQETYSYKGLGVFPKIESGTVMDKAHARAVSNDPDKNWAWKYAPQLSTILRVCIYNADPESEYYAIGAPQILVVRPKVKRVIDNYVGQLSTEDFVKLFDPDKEAQMLSLSFQKGSSGNVSFSTLPGTRPLPPLKYTPLNEEEQEFPPLDECYISTSKPRIPTAEESQKIEAMVSEVVSNHANVINPEPESTPTEPPVVSSNANNNDNPFEDDAGTPATNAGGDPVCPEENRGLKFGNHPLKDDPKGNYCILCDFADDCLEATKKALLG